MMRALTCLTVLTLALGACGEEGGETSNTNPTNNPTPGTMSDGTTTDATDGTTTDATTTTPTTDAMTTPGTDPTTDGTTTSPTDGTTTDPTTEPTTDPTDGTTIGTDGTDSTTTAGGDDLYGPCEMADPPCAGNQQCLMVTGIDGNFCAPMCDGMTCPDAPAGVTAMPQCALSSEGEMTPTSCALICNPMGGADQCGAGLTCKAVPMQAGVGLCTAP